MFQEYPKWVYPGGDAAKGVLVKSAEEEAALGIEAPAGDPAAAAAALAEVEAADPLAGLHDDKAVRAFAKDHGLKIQSIGVLKGDTLRSTVKAALAAQEG